MYESVYVCIVYTFCVFLSFKIVFIRSILLFFVVLFVRCLFLFDALLGQLADRVRESDFLSSFSSSSSSSKGPSPLQYNRNRQIVSKQLAAVGDTLRDTLEKLARCQWREEHPEEEEEKEDKRRKRRDDEEEDKKEKEKKKKERGEEEEGQALRGNERETETEECPDEESQEDEESEEKDRRKKSEKKEKRKEEEDSGVACMLESLNHRQEYCADLILQMRDSYLYTVEEREELEKSLVRRSDTVIQKHEIRKKHPYNLRSSASPSMHTAICLDMSTCRHLSAHTNGTAGTDR